MDTSSEVVPRQSRLRRRRVPLPTATAAQNSWLSGGEPQANPSSSSSRRQYRSTTTPTNPSPLLSQQDDHGISFRWHLVWQPSNNGSNSGTSKQEKDTSSDSKEEVDDGGGEWTRPLRANVKNECLVSYLCDESSPKGDSDEDVEMKRDAEGTVCITRVLVGQLAPIAAEVEFYRLDQSDGTERTVHVDWWRVLHFGHESHAPTLRLGLSYDADSEPSGKVHVVADWTISLVQRVFDVPHTTVDAMRTSLLKASAQISPSRAPGKFSVDIPVGAYRCPCNGCVCQDGQRGPIELLPVKTLLTNQRKYIPSSHHQQQQQYQQEQHARIDVVNEQRSRLRVHLQFNENSSHRKANPDSTRTFAFLGKFQGLFWLQARLSNGVERWSRGPLITLEKFGEKYRSLLAGYNAEHLVGRRPRPSQAPMTSSSFSPTPLPVSVSVSPSIVSSPPTPSALSPLDPSSSSSSPVVDQSSPPPFCSSLSRSPLDQSSSPTPSPPMPSSTRTTTNSPPNYQIGRPDDTDTGNSGTNKGTSANNGSNSIGTTSNGGGKQQEEREGECGPRNGRARADTKAIGSEGSVCFEPTLLRCVAQRKKGACADSDDNDANCEQYTCVDWQRMARQQTTLPLFCNDPHGTQSSSRRPVCFALDLHFARRVRNQSEIPLFNIDLIEPTALYDWKQGANGGYCLNLKFSWTDKSSGTQRQSSVYELRLEAREVTTTSTINNNDGNNRTTTTTMKTATTTATTTTTTSTSFNASSTTVHRLTVPAQCCGLVNDSTLRIPLDLHALYSELRNAPCVRIDVCLNKSSGHETLRKTIAQTFCAPHSDSVSLLTPTSSPPPPPEQWTLLPAGGRRESPAAKALRSEQQQQQQQQQQRRQRQQQQQAREHQREAGTKRRRSVNSADDDDNSGETRNKRTRSDYHEDDEEVTMGQILLLLEAESSNRSQQSIASLRAQRDLLLNLTHRYRRKYLALTSKRAPSSQ